MMHGQANMKLIYIYIYICINIQYICNEIISTRSITKNRGREL